MEEQTVSYRTYWSIWIVLLILTLAMIAVEAASFPALVAVVILLLAMMVKAAFIAGWFMHLKFERVALQLIVVLCTLLTVAFLFFLIAPDGIRMLQLSP